MNLVYLVMILILNLFSLSYAAEVDLGPAEFSLSENQRVVAVGDIHGDLHALKTILKSESLIDDEGVWVGGDSHLVFTGDLIDRGPESKQVMDFIMALEDSAKTEGGFVHTLLGNHEFLVTMGAFKYIHKNDITAFGEPEGSDPLHTLTQAFQGNSRYAKWFRSRKGIVKIGETLFVHGGLDDWALRYSLEQVNSNLNHWMQYLQGVASKSPTYGSRFFIEGEGPLWNRRFNPDAEDLHSVQNVDAYLLNYGVKRVVVGHTIVNNLEQTLRHPIFGSKVIMIDTAISIAYGGELSAIEINSDSIRQKIFDRDTGREFLFDEIKGTRKRIEKCTAILQPL